MPRARSTLLGVALSLIVCGQAMALPPGRSGVYGGGAVRDYMQFVSLRVLPGGGLGAHATLVTRCAPRFGDELTESIVVKNVKLDEHGRYSATSSFAGQADPGVAGTGGLFARGTTTFRAQVLPGGFALGTARVRTTYYESDGGPEVSRCDTGPVGWAARRPSADAGTGRPSLQPGTHRGTTAQGEPFLMRVSGGGRLVRRAGLTVRIGCPSAVGLPLDVVAQRVRVRRGAFGAGGDFERLYTDSRGRPVVERYSWELRGRFGERGARGTFELNGLVRRKSDGKRIGSCATGEIAWRASQ